MKEKYIDSHAHYMSGRFNKDREEVLDKIVKEDVKAIIECGTMEKSNKDVISLCELYDEVYGVIGFFPTDSYVLEDTSKIEVLKEQLKHPKIVGLGEIGLDYFHTKDEEERKKQQKYFWLQMKIAKEMNLPICIHSRDAEEDTLRELIKFGKNKGVIHCFSYGPKSMRRLESLGYYFGIGGTSTYPKNEMLRKAIRQMPINRILLETDCPYLAPQEVRGSRNDSSNIKYVIRNIAELKGISEEEVIRETNKNVKNLYGI